MKPKPKTLNGTKITKGMLWLITGGLSRPSKMPGYGWGLSAHWCNRGSKLREIAGTTCSKCYALAGQYALPSVLESHKRRLSAWLSNRELWTWGMVRLIRGDYAKDAKPTRWFRWLDSGDLQCVEMLEDFVAVANKTPETRHWNPTRERAIVKSFFDRGGSLPDNYVVRLSVDMVDTMPALHTSLGQQPGVCWSMVYTDNLSTKVMLANGIHICPATDPNTTEHSCDAHKCRACWSRKVKVVAYHQH